MNTIYDNLFQFSNYVRPIDLTFHQYLLASSEPLLVHTGDMGQAESLASGLKSILGTNPLRYIFISHFESDECGGLSVILREFPQAKPICSEVTARQLSGFGITNDVIVKKSGEKLSSDDYELEFISYPSEMHLWEGLLLMENKRGIFFSSDLMLRFGKVEDQTVAGSWQEEIDTIGPMQISDPEKRSQLKTELGRLDPKFLATGHGPCIRL